MCGSERHDTAQVMPFSAKGVREGGCAVRWGIQGRKGLEGRLYCEKNRGGVVGVG